MFDKLSEWLLWLEQTHPKKIDLGLDRIAKVGKRLGVLTLPGTVITVAGTNGKGSTITAIETLLLASGGRVAKYTSPHLLRFNERIVIDGKEVDNTILCDAFKRVYAALEGVSLTYFEFTTLVALLIFADAQSEYVLLEVGLGGRLDAVNIIDPDIAVITNIALDHQDWLGTDRESIAKEKAGIIRSSVPVIVGDISPPQSLRNLVDSLDARAFWNGSEFAIFRSEKGEWVWRGRHFNGAAVEYSVLPAGHLHANSWAMALQVVSLCNVLPSDDKIRLCIQETALLGRYTKVDCGDLSLLIDVAHNIDAVKQLRDNLLRDFVVTDQQPSITAIFAAMKDKPVEEMLALLDPYIKRWLFIDLPGNSRAMLASETMSLYRDNVGSGECACFASVEEAMSNLNTIAMSTDKVLVFGSFFTAAEALKLR